jgi:branched-chain amino acid transport system ATP-binding protein
VTEPLLAVRDLSAGYGGSSVLEGVSLRVDAGETVVVLGPNGHGKSTLVRAISGLVPDQGGAIEFLGRRIDGLSPAQIVALGLVQIPQGDLLFPEMSVLENLLAAVANQRSLWKARRGRLEHVFELFPLLRQRAGQPANTLSGGERRMLALGRGLMALARLLVIDEPALGLAPTIVDEVYQRIADIKESGVAILLIEESANHLGVADRVYLLQNGRIERESDGATLLNDAALVDTYFFGEPA